MRSTSIALTWVAGLLVAGCGESPLTPNDIEPQLSVAGEARQTADVFTLGDPPEQVEGSSFIRRRSHAVRVGIRTSELLPRHAYTAWLVIFNDPDGCVEECGEDDLFNPDAVVDIVYLAGRMSNQRGRVALRGHRVVGDHSGSLFAQLGVPAPGLVDPERAEVHVIVRDHGEPIRGHLREQLGTFEGGCTPESSFGLGDGPNECVDVQVAVHLPH